MKINHECKNNQLSDTLSFYLKKASNRRTSSSYRCLSWLYARLKRYASASWPPVSTRQHHLLPATQESYLQLNIVANPLRPKYCCSQSIFILIFISLFSILLAEFTKLHQFHYKSAVENIASSIILYSHLIFFCNFAAPLDKKLQIL